MIVCDLCGQPKECLQKEIDGREFDICVDCWQPFEEKLKGKGRVQRKRVTVFLPPPPAPQPEEQRTPPGLPPTIFGTVCAEAG
jgi:ribosome-binding protein aMBF1 (putative translation factor)